MNGLILYYGSENMKFCKSLTLERILGNSRIKLSIYFRKQQLFALNQFPKYMNN